MRNWKDKVLGIFAGIGLMALLMGSYAQQSKGIWEFHLSSGEGGTSSETYAFAINTETGEVRKYNSYYTGIEGKSANENFNIYRVTQQK